MIDTIIFYFTLIVSITLASYYKRIDDLELKKNYGVCLGVLIACLICGTEIIHTIFMVWGNIVILTCSNKRNIHHLSLCYTWLYLLYFHIHLVNAKYVIWLHQTIALRLVGMAFEMHNAYTKTSPRPSSSMRTDSPDDLDETEPTVSDIISYAFFFIGLHKGPYYKWKIFREHLNGSFGLLGDCRIITEQKIKKLIFCVVCYLLLRMKFTPYIYYEDRFYGYFDMDTRYLYNIPLLLMFFLQHQIIMLLSTSACTEAGFGVYPAKYHPLPGHGPSVGYSVLKFSDISQEALELEYNFSMLKCFENDRLLVGPRMKDTLKSWDMSTRYWFWVYTYKNMLIKADKEIRSLCSHIAWTLWSGPSFQQILISSTLWVYVHLESEYADFYETSTSMKVPWDIGFSMMRMFCLIYLTPCFIINDTAIIFKYYNSIFWVFHGILLVFIIGAIVIYRTKERF